MNKVECYRCKSTPLTTPIGKLVDYYAISELVIICETCLKKVIEDDWEHAEDEDSNNNRA